MALTLKVNGKSRRVAAEPDTPLLYVLRNDLELNARQIRLRAGAMRRLHGAGRRRRRAPACTPAGGVADAEIVTLEGLGTLDNLHPLQQAFIAEQAAQCGYCIAGMIMSAKALLDRNPASERSRGRARRWPAISAAAAPMRASSARCCARRP